MKKRVENKEKKRLKKDENIAKRHKKSEKIKKRVEKKAIRTKK